MTDIDRSRVSIILPAKNEAASLEYLLPELKNCFPDSEIIVVDDGSTDKTGCICRSYDIKLARHPYSKGNGSAIKSGAREASGDILVFMDADGQHSVNDISGLLDTLENGYDMVVGERLPTAQANYGRGVANKIYNRLASLISGREIHDLTSGFRVVKADKFKQFIYLLPNGFSYPTTITMAFLRAGYSVAYKTVDVKTRTGKSHISPIKDGARFFLIIFRVGVLYSPLKIFAPISLILFLFGCAHYSYTYYMFSRFTNMSGLLFSIALIVFLIGLLSEQITMLLYSKVSDK